ncbi:MAG TPA: rhamnulokinase family protein [Chthoniobacteraceae bacterium]|jgi:rhamnulokinase
MNEHTYIACDLGAESGRVILGRLRDGKVTLEEIHRFPNGAVKIAGSLRWNILRIFEELKLGVRKVAAMNLSVEGLSVDSWGVDYVLLGAGQPMLSLPYQYRDARTDSTYAAALESPGRELIFAETGIQFMQINTLYHLIAELEQSPRLLEIAEQFLTIADYLHFLFSGVAAIEESLASTTQLYNPVARAWSQRLIETFGFPSKIFPPLVSSGTRLGPLLPEMAAELGAGPIEVIATCSHDTGAAVAAVPALGEDWAYLSSGTWSLIGVELPQPLISEEARLHNFTNEAGFGGTTRFLKNIIGLWILQECRRTWALAGQEFNYATLNLQAEQAESFRSLIDPNDARFLKPDRMPEKIAAYCRETGQPEPETPGQFARCIFESLALLYRRTLEELQQVTGKKINRLHIVGGGSQSTLLNQFAASAIGRPVLAGPLEATAAGNVLIQAIALGHLESLSALRGVVRDSFTIAEYAPQESAEWELAYGRFEKLRVP